MVDGILLLVDAAEGPLPQTRYVLQKALSLNLPAIVVINKVDRGDARAEEVLDEVYQLFIDLEADDHHIDFSVISAVAREGRTMVGLGMPAQDADLSALLDTIIDRIPAPTGDPEAPLQALVTNLDASEYLGRLAIGRVYQGVLRKGENVQKSTLWIVDNYPDHRAVRPKSGFGDIASREAIYGGESRGRGHTPRVGA